MKKHVSVMVLLGIVITALPLVFTFGYVTYNHPNPMVSDKKLVVYKAQYKAMDQNFQDMITICKSSSYYSAQTACVVEYLKAHDDYHCNEGLCCGGNSIGWFECF